LVAPLIAATIIVDIIQDVRGSVAMMMFILEESIQTAMMAEWLATKAELWPEALELNSWIKQYLADQLEGVSDASWAYAAYPLNHAYKSFALATLQSLEMYKKIINEKLGS
jgi:hypothetical protein